MIRWEYVKLPPKIRNPRLSLLIGISTFHILAEYQHLCELQISIQVEIQNLERSAHFFKLA